MRDVIQVNRNGTTYQMNTAGLTNRDSYTRWKKELAEHLLLDEHEMIHRALVEFARRADFRPPPPRRGRKTRADEEDV